MDVEGLRGELEAVAAGHDVPGLVLAVARGGEAPSVLAVGRDGAGRALTADSLLPVASVTKLATALAVLRLVDRGELGLDDPLGQHLPDAAAAGPGVTLRAVLCHTAGLAGDLPDGAVAYDHGLTWPAMAEAFLRTPAERPPGGYVGYSNTGPALLAVMLERRFDRPFREVLDALVLGPLGVEGYLGVEPPRPVAHIADVPSEHVGTELEPFNSAFWRQLALPYGGMVTTAAGALALARAFAGHPSGFLSPDVRTEATRDQTGGLAGRLIGPLVWDRNPWGLGVELRGDKAPHYTPAEAGPGSFGHLGASGCIAWHDPGRATSWAVLGARTMASMWVMDAFPRIGAAVLARASTGWEHPGAAADRDG